MQTIRQTYIIGDIHGHYKRLVKLLQEVGLIGHSLSWTGKDAALWFLGDFVDRGPDGVPVLDLVMRLQAEAPATGGQVGSLLGNHEVLLLAAYRFGRRSTGLGSNFIGRWKRNGGNRKDLASLTLEHLSWLANLLPMAIVEEHLLIHADAPIYLKHGRSVEEVNEAFGKILHRSDALAWEEILEDFARRGIFCGPHNGEEFAQRFLKLYGGQRVVHGHTPISSMVRTPPKKVTSALVYAGGRCINIDGGMYLGGPGFIYQLPH